MNPEDIAARSTAFKVEYADVVMNWNNLEKLTGHLLHTLLGHDSRAEVITTRMQASGYSEALNALAEFKGDPLRTDVREYSKRFDRLRAWRNHYVHGVYLHIESEGTGLIQSVGIKKGRLGMTNVIVNTEELRQMNDRLIKLEIYLSSIIACAGGFSSVAASGAGPRLSSAAPAFAPDLPQQSLYPYFQSIALSDGLELDGGIVDI